MKLGVVGLSVSHVSGMIVGVLFELDVEVAGVLGEFEVPEVDPVAEPLFDFELAAEFEVPDVDSLGDIALPDVEPIGDVEDPAAVPVGRVDETGAVPVDEPDEFVTITFGFGGATAFPELKSESNTTTIPADLEKLSESLIE